MFGMFQWWAILFCFNGYGTTSFVCFNGYGNCVFLCVSVCMVHRVVLYLSVGMVHLVVLCVSVGMVRPHVGPRSVLQGLSERRR